MESIYIGLDVHQKSTTICIQDEEGTELALTSCSTDRAGFARELGPWLAKHPGSRVGLESCSKAYVVSGIVERLGGDPWVIPADEAAEIFRCLGDVAKRVLAVTSAEGYNVLQNNGRVAGQVVMHVHFHIIPRHADDGLGYRWKPQPAAPDALAALAKRIREA